MKKLIMPLLLAVFLVAGCATTANVSSDMPVPEQNVKDTVVTKEFSMNSFYSPDTGPQFSVRELTVKKGDTVVIHITNTKGNHDFNIDEFGVSAETPLNSTVTVQFVADKAGSFVYYCSKPGHRAAGHWGTLKIIE